MALAAWALAHVHVDVVVLLQAQVVEVGHGRGLEGPGLGPEGGLALEQLEGQRGPRRGEGLRAVAEELQRGWVGRADTAADGQRAELGGGLERAGQDHEDRLAGHGTVALEHVLVVRVEQAPAGVAARVVGVGDLPAVGERHEVGDGRPRRRRGGHGLRRRHGHGRGRGGRGGRQGQARDLVERRRGHVGRGELVDLAVGREGPHPLAASLEPDHREALAALEHERQAARRRRGSGGNLIEGRRGHLVGGHLEDAAIGELGPHALAAALQARDRVALAGLQDQRPGRSLGERGGAGLGDLVEGRRDDQVGLDLEDLALDRASTHLAGAPLELGHREPLAALEHDHDLVGQRQAGQAQQEREGQAGGGRCLGSDAVAGHR